MEDLFSKINKLSLPVTILIASVVLGSFYYVSEVNKQQSIEKQQQIKIEQEKQNQLDQELKEQEVKKEDEQALNACIVDAENVYSNQWYKECKSRGELTNKCISLKEMTFSEYSDQNPPPSHLKLGSPELLNYVSDQLIDFYKKRDECSCRLPLVIGSIINENLEKNKNECFKRYPQ